MKAYSYSSREMSVIKKKNMNDRIVVKRWFKASIIRQRVKNHYAYQQGLVCCYCRRPLHGIGGSYHLEHILCQSLYIQFISEPLNLSVACEECNGAKSAYDALHPGFKRPPKIYPNKGRHYCIPHPHFDKYSRHVEIKRRIFYVMKTSKGANLIMACRLNERLALLANFPAGISYNSLVIQAEIFLNDRKNRYIIEANEAAVEAAIKFNNIIIHGYRGRQLLANGAQP